MNEGRVYRGPISVLVFGLIFALVALGFTGTAVYCLLTGTTIPFSVNDGPVHPSARGELLFMACFPLLHLGVGVGVILSWLNARTILTGAGLEHRNWLNKVDFSASWGELTSFRTVPSRGGPTNLLYAGSRELKLGMSDVLLAAIRSHAPQIVDDTWHAR